MSQSETVNLVNNIEELERRIDYSFKNKKILETAITHSSYIKEHSKDGKSNERLEFLGDAFFDAIIGEELFTVFNDKEEGFLSQLRAALVCETSLAEAAGRLEIGEFLRLGRGEEKNGGRSRKSILADALEAIMGAVYLDGGFEEVKRVVLCIFADAVRDVEVGKLAIKDYKTNLQEILQKSGSVDIKYNVIKQEGPDHDKTFTVRLFINGKPETTGVGKSKKKAEQQAAKHMMEKL